MAFTCSLVVEDRIAKITLTGELDAASAGWIPRPDRGGGHARIRAPSC